MSAMREMRIQSLTGEDTEPFAVRVAQVTGAGHGAATAGLLASLGAAVAVNHHRDNPATTAIMRGIQAAVGPATAMEAAAGRWAAARIGQQAGGRPTPGRPPAGSGESLASPWPQSRCPCCGTVLDGGPVLFRCARCARAVHAADLDVDYRPADPHAGTA